MGGKVPFKIKKRVIRQWLNGDPRDQIAKDNDIGFGTVSAIVKQGKYELDQEYDVDEDDNFEFDLTRELAINLKRKGQDVNSVASAVRLQAKLEKKGLSEEQIYSFIDNIDVHCYKQDMKIEEFVNIIHKVCALSDNLAIPVGKLPEYISQGQKKIEELKNLEKRKIEALENLEKRTTEAVKSHGMTMNTLQEYQRNRPIAEKLRDTQKELEEVKIQRDYYEDEMYRKVFELYMSEYEWAVTENELDLVSEKLNAPYDIDQHIKLVRGLVYNPSEHIDIIRTLRERLFPSLSSSELTKTAFQN